MGSVMKGVRFALREGGRTIGAGVVTTVTCPSGLHCEVGPSAFSGWFFSIVSKRRRRLRLPGEPKEQVP